MKQIFNHRAQSFIARRLGIGDELNLLDRHTRQLLFTFGFSIIGGGVLLVYSLTYLGQGNPGHAAVDFFFALSAAINIFFLRRGGRLLLATSFIVGLMIVLALYLLVSGGLVGTGFLWMFTIPILAFFLEGTKRGVAWTAILIAGVLFIGLGQSRGIVVTPHTLAELTQIVAGLITIGVMIGLFEVITERYENLIVEQSNELQKFRLAVVMATDAVLMTDQDGVILYVNQAWQKLTGYTSSDVLGKNRRILQNDKTSPALYNQMWKNIRADRPFTSDEFIKRRKDGMEYMAELDVYPIWSDHKLLYVVQTMRDISERKAIDRAKTEFVSLAAHQLSTPLSAISWFSELVLDGASGPLNDQQKHLVNRIDQSNRHMISLVNSLLNSSRIDLGTFIIAPAPTNLGTIIREVVEESRAGFPDGPQAVVTIQHDLPPVNVDLNLFTMIVQNLVTNALRYTPVDGQVTVDLSVDTYDVILTVIDSGIGIPEQDQSKIFTKLFRSSNASAKVPNGNGLGLYIVKAVIDQSGGKIGFTSKPGKGTTFTIRIPLTGMKERQGARELTRDL